MRVFRRRKPLHERLADAGGLETGARGPTGLSSEPPGWDGEPRGESGIHGVPRPRRWDTVVQAEASDLVGDAVHFVALDDGTLVVDEDEPDAALTPLAEAVEQSLRPPYRAEAVRRGPATWAGAARRIAITTVPDVIGDEAGLTSTRGGQGVRGGGVTPAGAARAPGEGGA